MKKDQGFTLVEVMVSMLVLTTGLMGLLGVFTLGIQRVSGSTPALIAREKAREAVESVHSARDTGEFAWNTILNVSAGGVFLDGQQSLRTPGNDGLVGTADDGAIETVRKPGADGLFNTQDDQLLQLTDFRRQIQITPLLIDGTQAVDPNLRQVTVTITYRVDGFTRTYRLVTYISSFA